MISRCATDDRPTIPRPVHSGRTRRNALTTAPLTRELPMAYPVELNRLIQMEMADLVGYGGHMMTTPMTREQLHARLDDARRHGRPALLDGAQLEGADLRGLNLSGAFLHGAHLAGADLGQASLSGAYLQRADLRGANLQQADLQRANLREANLTDANLQDANLHDAQLGKATLTNIDLPVACSGDDHEPRRRPLRPPHSR